MTYDIKSIKDKLNAARDVERKRKECADPIGWRAEIELLKKELLIPADERYNTRGMEKIVKRLQHSLEDFCEHPEKYLDAENAKETDISNFLIEVESSLPFAQALLNLARDLEKNKYRVHDLSENNLTTLRNLNDSNQINLLVNAMLKVYFGDDADFSMPVDYCIYTIGADDKPRALLQNLFNLSVKSPDYIKRVDQIKDWENIISTYESQDTHDADLLRKINRMKTALAQKSDLKRRNL